MIYSGHHTASLREESKDPPVGRENSIGTAGGYPRDSLTVTPHVQDQSRDIPESIPEVHNVLEDTHALNELKLKDLKKSPDGPKLIKENAKNSGQLTSLPPRKPSVGKSITLTRVIDKAKTNAKLSSGRSQDKPRSVRRKSKTAGRPLQQQQAIVKHYSSLPGAGEPESKLATNQGEKASTGKITLKSTQKAKSSKAISKASAGANKTASEVTKPDAAADTKIEAAASVEEADASLQLGKSQGAIAVPAQ